MILFCLFVVTALISCNGVHEQISELEKNEYFETISRLLKPRSKPDLYYRLHREVLDVLGKAHSSPLQRFVTKNNTIISQTEITLTNTLASVSQIKAIAIIIFEQHWHWLQAETKSSEDYNSIIGKVEKITDDLYSAISGLLVLLPIIELSRKNGSSVDKEITSKFIDAKIKGIESLKIGKKLHDGLFTKLGIQEIKTGVTLFPFASTIQKFIDFEKEFEKDGDPRIIKWHQLGENETEDLFNLLEKSDIEEVFIVWDEEIKEAVRDVFSNVRRIAEKIVNPWKSTNDDKAHLWYRIQLSKLTAKIEMKNKTTNTAEFIENETKDSHSHYIIKDIGGSINYSKDNDSLLLTVISLPYAHTLQIQSKGEAK